MEPLINYEARRILLIKPSALGDVVQTLPVLTALRQRYPKAHITWLINRSYEALLRGHPDLDATLGFDRGALRRGWWTAARHYLATARTVRQSAFDLVIDLQGLLRSGLFTAASRAARRVGLASAREGATWFYTDRLPGGDLDKTHAVDRYWLVAQALGVGQHPKEFRFPSFSEERAWAETSLRGCPRPWIALGVGARWLTKRWPPEHFAELARRAQARFGGTLVFVGSPDEADLAWATLVRVAGPWRDFSGRTTLPQLASLLSLCDVMVSNDTGPLHLAAALGCPVVAPYTCTRVALNGPYGWMNNTVETTLSCQGSYLTRCPIGLACMRELTPARVWPLLERTLEQRGVARVCA